MKEKYRITINESGKYQVKKDNAEKASRVFDKHDDAVEYASNLASKQKTEFIDESTKLLTKRNFQHLKRIVSFIIVLLLGLGGYIVYENYGPSIGATTNPSIKHDGVIYDDFQLHFMELGNDYNGDCTYIKVLNGDEQIDILIDAGSRKSSSQTIKDYLDTYVTDNKLEFVISTHADQDHIAGFVGSVDGNSRDGILYEYEIDTFIQFDYSNKTTQLYEDYLDAVDYIESKGTKVYTASECFNNENGAKDVYELAPDITMRTLYNKYYFEEDKDENNYSVVTLFSVKGQDFLFTGDLEKEGEEHLVDYYTKNPGILGECVFYKAGHHGSKTSSSMELLNIIKPQISVVNCVAGKPEYTDYIDNIFPTQQFIDNISHFTSAVYIPVMYNEDTKDYEPLNGNIIISSNLNEVGVACSNNTTELKDSVWFNKEVYVDDNNKLTIDSSYTKRPFRITPEGWL